MFQPRQSFLHYRSFLEKGGHGDPFALRVTQLNQMAKRDDDFVLYWAQSARRLRQNMALNMAIQQANLLGLPVVVYESLRPDYPEANDRIHTFVLQGVADNIRDAEERGLRYIFFLPKRTSEARGVLASLSKRARLIVTDEYPAFIMPAQTRAFAARSQAPLWLIDGNGILPMRAMPGEQYGAKFFRDRAHRMFEAHWIPIVEVDQQADSYTGDLEVEAWDGRDPWGTASRCEINHAIRPVSRSGGRVAALQQLEDFVNQKLRGYASLRNRETNRTSGLSPYLHFGYLSIHEVADRVLSSDAPKLDIDAFLEEAIIRRELSFNLCHFRADHDSLSVLPDWARKTLAKHAGDRRNPRYGMGEMERAETGDDVWNLAQRGLLVTGTIHNYLRMLWGKRIIEWSESVDDAHQVMMTLHDRYAIDGRDPNTHAGVLWCFGKHDRAWGERPIFGSVRYMSSEATRKKVDLNAYAESIELEEQRQPRFGDESRVVNPGRAEN